MNFDIWSHHPPGPHYDIKDCLVIGPEERPYAYDFYCVYKSPSYTPTDLCVSMSDLQNEDPNKWQHAHNAAFQGYPHG